VLPWRGEGCFSPHLRLLHQENPLSC